MGDTRDTNLLDGRHLVTDEKPGFTDRHAGKRKDYENKDDQKNYVLAAMVSDTIWPYHHNCHNDKIYVCINKGHSLPYTGIMMQDIVSGIPG